MKQKASGNPMVFSRVDENTKQELRDAAAEDFDGNESLAVRVALKQWLADRRARKEVIQRATQAA